VIAAKRLPRWKRSRCIRVATNVSTVKTNTAGTATREFAHTRSREATNSIKKLDQYPAPRKAAVRGTDIDHAK
jgi:hypothetical protein